MALTAGARLGPHAILSLLGPGVMGMGPNAPFDISRDARHLVITDATTLASEVWLLEPRR